MCLVTGYIQNSILKFYISSPSFLQRFKYNLDLSTHLVTCLITNIYRYGLWTSVFFLYASTQSFKIFRITHLLKYLQAQNIFYSTRPFKNLCEKLNISNCQSILQGCTIKLHLENKLPVRILHIYQNLKVPENSTKISDVTFIGLSVIVRNTRAHWKKVLYLKTRALRSLCFTGKRSTSGVTEHVF